MKHLLLTILICLPLTVFAEGNLIPQEIEWDGDVYAYDPYWKKYESRKLGDFDGDGKNEIVVSFMGSIKDTVVHRPFYLIYDVINEKEKLAKTIIGNMYLEEIEIIDLEKDGQKEIAVFSSGGAHYTDLYIYKWISDSYECIFENGSACGIETDFEAEPPKITVGRENWDKEGWCYASGDHLGQVYVWDGKGFIYDEKLSTTVEVSEAEATQRFVKEAKELMDKVTDE